MAVERARAQFDRLILGANPLVGVDHYSSERARARLQSSNVQKSASVLRAAMRSGATGFNFERTTATPLFEVIENESWARELGLYPILPSDTGGLVGAYRSEGLQAAARVFLDGLKWSDKTKAIVQGGFAWLSSDPIRAMKVYIDVELNRIIEESPPRARLKTVLLHEIITDIALALETEDVIQEYCNCVEDRHQLTPGLITRNLPLFVSFCKRHDIDLSRIALMTPLNPIAFQMAPSREACEAVLPELAQCHLIAISALASGQVPPKAAAQYLSHLPEVDAVCLGASTPEHAEETFEEFSKIFAASREISE